MFYVYVLDNAAQTYTKKLFFTTNYNNFAPHNRKVYLSQREDIVRRHCPDLRPTGHKAQGTRRKAQGVRASQTG